VKTLHRNPAAKQFAASMKPFSSIPEKPLKPARDSVCAAGRTKGFDHVDADLDIVSRVLPGTVA